MFQPSSDEPSLHTYAHTTFQSDMDTVYFKDGQETNNVELKVPVEDVDNEREPSKA